MAGEPWWIEQVKLLLSSDAVRLGPLWDLSTRLQFVRDNVDESLLEADHQAHPHSRALWSDFVAREGQVQDDLEDAARRLARTICSGALGKEAFRASWETLGFAPHAEGGGTPADDHLDALFGIVRHSLGEQRQPFAMPNMSSRAHRVADFLAVTEPGPDDVVLDIGSGSGKVALTVGASTFAEVRGVECGESYVAAARHSAAELGLDNVAFEHADVRDVDLSPGSIFYLYYPFHGEPARAVAESLGRLGRTKDITVYGSGPGYDFGEHFMRQVDEGALELGGLRGEFSEAFVLRSARG